jgi:2-(1,2-epoxy-1,2-dihydrophenyl)acetyl-CoA isomerase
MTMFGDEVNAAEALAWGLVNDVVPSDQLIGVAEAWGRRLATGPTTALGLITRLLEEGADSSFENALEGEARAQHIVTTTHDLAEGIRAYLERREPNFRGV